jgi:hypothetical protein
MTPSDDTLFFGDNLDVLREHIEDESVDLIYLDPPFNSNANYNVLFKAPSGDQSQAQIEAFEDTWRWSEAAERAFDEVMDSGHTDAAEMLRAMRGMLRENDMMAYLAMMAVRLIELHRVLKPTGSLYLHCDPTASHYLKILLDAVFDARHFRNEIVWKRTSSHNDTGRFGRIHDTIFYYARSEKYKFNVQRRETRRKVRPKSLYAIGRKWSALSVRQHSRTRRTRAHLRVGWNDPRVEIYRREDEGSPSRRQNKAISRWDRDDKCLRSVFGRERRSARSRLVGRHRRYCCSFTRTPRLSHPKARRPPGAHPARLVQRGRSRA